jgi:hypothetical protein
LEGIGEDDVKALASRALKDIKLPRDVKERLDKLRGLSEKAEAGDRGAREELKQALLESSPAIITRASDVSRKSQPLIIAVAAGGDPLTEYALSVRLDMMRAELAGENPTPLEALLVERVVSAWILHELLEVLNSAQLACIPDVNRVPHPHLKFYLGWQEQIHRRLLSSIKTLAQVRRLQSGIPSSQTNLQIDLATNDRQAEAGHTS